MSKVVMRGDISQKFLLSVTFHYAFFASVLVGYGINAQQRPHRHQTICLVL